MRVSLGIFNANFGLISVCVNAEGFCGWLLFSFSESMLMNAPKSGCRPGVMQWVSAFILWLESCAESLLKSQTARDALICANSTAGVSFSVFQTAYYMQVFDANASMPCIVVFKMCIVKVSPLVMKEHWLKEKQYRRGQCERKATRCSWNTLQVLPAV